MRPIAAPINITPPNVKTPRTQRTTDEARVIRTASGGPYSHIMIGRSTANTTAVTATVANAALIGRNLTLRATSATRTPVIRGPNMWTPPQNSEAGN